MDDARNAAARIDLVALIRSDLERYLPERESPSLLDLANVLLLTQGAWASTVYRLGHGVWHRRGVAWALPKALAIVAHKAVEVVAGISLPPSASVGPGIYFGHFGQIIVSPNATIGANCNINQGATIGRGWRGGRIGVPALGNRVWVGANAVLYGPIVVGDDVAIGPNCVVHDDVPPRAVLGAGTARIRGYGGSFAWVRYRGEERDADRLRSLAQAAAESQRQGESEGG